MRIRRLIFLLAVPLALAACESSTDPEPAPSEVEGGWLRVNEQPATANVIEHLGFGAGGRYARDVMIFRDLAGGTLVSSLRQEGTYRLTGERLELRITRETDWDAERGGPPVVTERPETWADAGTLRIEGVYMHRTYITYPADAPVETTARYHKVLPD
ncbi:MAG TPA: hypothetical protein VFR81_19335 [Longimicrobium sp.]|nr:hypothetical protein [Longimicrobium sp.]